MLQRENITDEEEAPYQAIKQIIQYMIDEQKYVSYTEDDWKQFLVSLESNIEKVEQSHMKQSERIKQLDGQEDYVTELEEKINVLQNFNRELQFYEETHHHL